MATSFFGGNFFGGEFFNTPAATTAVKTGTGGIDPGEGLKRRYTVKPTGLLHLPKKLKEGRKDVSDRIDESREIQAEIASRLAREFTEETGLIEDQKPIVEMTMAEIDHEIGLLLRKKLLTDDEEILLLFLMMASSA